MKKKGRGNGPWPISCFLVGRIGQINVGLDNVIVESEPKRPNSRFFSVVRFHSTGGRGAEDTQKNGDWDSISKIESHVLRAPKIVAFP